MKFELTNFSSLKRKSFDETNDQKMKKKPGSKKLDREELLQNFPLFTNLAVPNRFSILNINYNKFHDNNIINVKNQNSNSSVRTKSNPKMRSDVVKQNLRDILSSKILDSKKQTSFFKAGLERKQTAFNVNEKKSSLLLRNSSQKSNLFKINGNKQKTTGFHFMIPGKSETKSKKSLITTKDKLSGIFEKNSKNYFKSFKQLRAEKSLPSNIGRRVDPDDSYCYVDTKLITSVNIFKKKFSKFLRSSLNVKDGDDM